MTAQQLLSNPKHISNNPEYVSKLTDRYNLQYRPWAEDSKDHTQITWTITKGFDDIIELGDEVFAMDILPKLIVAMFNQDGAPYDKLKTLYPKNSTVPIGLKHEVYKDKWLEISAQFPKN